MQGVFRKIKIASYNFVAATDLTSVTLSIIGGGMFILPITSMKMLADFE